MFVKDDAAEMDRSLVENVTEQTHTTVTNAGDLEQN